MFITMDLFSSDNGPEVVSYLGSETKPAAEIRRTINNTNVVGTAGSCEYYLSQTTSFLRRVLTMFEHR